MTKPKNPNVPLRRVNDGVPRTRRSMMLDDRQYEFARRLTHKQAGNKALYGSIAEFYEEAAAMLINWYQSQGKRGK